MTGLPPAEETIKAAVAHFERHLRRHLKTTLSGHCYDLALPVAATDAVVCNNIHDPPCCLTDDGDINESAPSW